MIGVFPGRTSEQAGGEKSGVQVQFTEDDYDRISNSIQGIEHISPTVQKDVPVQNDLHTYTWTVNGVQPVLQDIWKLNVRPGEILQRVGRRAARACLRDRLRGQDEAVLRRLGGWANRFV